MRHRHFLKSQAEDISRRLAAENSPALPVEIRYPLVAPPNHQMYERFEPSFLIFPYNSNQTVFIYQAPKV